MPNHNIIPRPENLTRAGMGQPKKGRSRVQITLPPELIAHLDKIAAQQKWNRSETVEYCCRAILDFNPHFDEADFALIRQGHGVE